MQNEVLECRTYKKRWKKRFYGRYIRFQNRWRLRLAPVAAFFQGGLTLMFVPHSERRVLKFRFMNSIILSIVLLLVGAVVFSLAAMNAEETRSTRISSYQSSSRRMAVELRAFRERAKVAYRLYLALQQQMHLLEEITGLNASGPYPGPIGRGSPPQDWTSDADLCGLEEMGSNFRVIGRRVATFSRYIRTLRGAFRHIPSIWPLMGRDGVVTSAFGERPSPFTGLLVQHTGLDIASYWGSPIRATADGVVEEAAWLGGYGLCVVVRHSYGIRTRYAHLSSIRVTPGQQVRQGEFIARMGNTGLAIGFHLHYEVIVGIKPIDPQPFLQSIF